MRITDTIRGDPRGTANEALSHIDGPSDDDDLFVRAIYANAPKVGIDPAIVMAQVHLESAGLTSPRYLNDKNPSGLGIPQDNTPQPFVIPDYEVAALMHLSALNRLVDGTKAEPWTLPANVEAWLSSVWKRHCDQSPPVRTIDDLNRRYEADGDSHASWAWDAGYQDKLIERARVLFPNLPPQGATPQPPEVPPVPDDITFGLVPLPPMQDRLVTNSTAWNDLGARVIRGVVWHRMLGWLLSTDGYFRGEAAGRALTDHGIGVAQDGANDGVIFKWNDARGRRSPWANGPVSAPYGDGKAFVDRYGINASQRDLVSIEISGMQTTPLTEKSRQAIAHLTAYWADQYHVPWQTFPAVPNEGRSFVIWHTELTKGTGKECPFEVVKAETNALIARAKAIMQQFQSSGEPVPVPPPTPVPPPPGIDYPDHLDKELMERMFGAVTGEDGNVYRYTEEGKVSAIWREQYGSHGWPALAEVWSYDNGGRRYFRFPGAPTIFVGGDGVPVIVKEEAR